MSHDAIVIGGGPAGSTSAIMLARAGWRVAIVEKSRFPRRKVCGEFISASNAALLAGLGVADAFAAQAGPEVRRVGLYARDVVLASPMPRAAGGRAGWGRALGRETLDAMLLQRAADCGADVRLPCKAVQLERDARRFVCRIASDGGDITLAAPVVIAAHGSWERGGLPSQPAREHAASDLLGFKAHFRGAELAPDVMPLVAFPGGYGGMVHSDGGRVSLSCCVRRDALSRWRASAGESNAGAAVLRHISRSCLGVRHDLARARLEGAWLSAGPINPGIRGGFADGVFLVGNAAGEAHPIVAEGISMAMQSAFLLSRRLIASADDAAAGRGLAEIGAAYSAEWRTHFATRIRAAALFARLAMRPGAAALLPVIRRFPAILTLGAALSGKTKPIGGEIEA